MNLVKLVVCAVLALVLVVGLTVFLASIFDQDEHAIQVIPMDTVPPEQRDRL